MPWLLALAVIFLPMLFTREDELRQVRIDAPAMPQTPEMPPVEMETVPVPEPQVLPEEPVPPLDGSGQASALPVAPAEQPGTPCNRPSPRPPRNPRPSRSRPRPCRRLPRRPRRKKSA